MLYRERVVEKISDQGLIFSSCELRRQSLNLAVFYKTNIRKEFAFHLHVFQSKLVHYAKRERELRRVVGREALRKLRCTLFPRLLLRLPRLVRQRLQMLEKQQIPPLRTLLFKSLLFLIPSLSMLVEHSPGITSLPSPAQSSISQT